MRAGAGRLRGVLRIVLIGMIVLGLGRALVGLAPRGELVEVPLRALEVPAGLHTADAIPGEHGALVGRNLLLVTLDTTRPDRIGCYGNPAIETPQLDRLAREGILFSNAIAVAPTTLPTHASILTGLYPLHHGARTNSRFGLGAGHTTLAERLSEHGYATAAFVSAFVLDAQFGLDRGFDHYDDAMGLDAALEMAERSADRTTDAALRWLRRPHAGPFFAWVHYYDPHAAYRPPEPYASRHALAYDGEIAFVDRELGRLLTGMRAASSGETLVAVVGDHGEALGAHGESTHGMLVQEATIRIPLLLHAPSGLASGVHVDTRASQVDLMPTLLSLLGIEAVAPVDGQSLLRAPAPERALYVENLEPRVMYGAARLAALYRGDWKLTDAPQPELYDLAADPLEREDLRALEPDRVAALRREVQKIQSGAPDRLEPAVGLEPEEVRRLVSLGYVVGDTREFRASGPGTDPRALVPGIEELQTLASLAAGELPAWARVLGRLQGQSMPQGPEQLTAAYEAIARSDPDFAPVHFFLSELHREAGRETEAQQSLARLARAVERAKTPASGAR